MLARQCPGEEEVSAKGPACGKGQGRKGSLARRGTVAHRKGTQRRLSAPSVADQVTVAHHTSLAPENNSASAPHQHHHTAPSRPSQHITETAEQPRRHHHHRNRLVMAARRQADTLRKDAHAGTLRRPVVASAAPREGRGPGEPNRGLAVPRPNPSVHLPGCLPAACEPAHLGAAQPPLRAYPPPPTHYVRGPFTICRRPPREGGRPGCRQHQRHSRHDKVHRTAISGPHRGRPYPLPSRPFSSASILQYMFLHCCVDRIVVLW